MDSNQLIDSLFYLYSVAVLLHTFTLTFEYNYFPDIHTNSYRFVSLPVG
jgi:hypothetical protein